MTATRLNEQARGALIAEIMPLAQCDLKTATRHCHWLWSLDDGQLAERLQLLRSQQRGASRVNEFVSPRGEMMKTK